MRLTFEYPGLPLTWVKIAPGNTITQVPAGLYKYAEYTINYDAGSDEIVEGDVFIGVSSGAMGIVKSITLVSGGWGVGNDAAGVIRFHSWNGINFTNNEKIQVAADATCADIDGTAPTACADEYQYKGWLAKCVIAQAHTNSQLIAYGKNVIKPDQTALLGQLLTAGSSVQVSDASAIANIRVVDYTAGTAGFTAFVGCF